MVTAKEWLRQFGLEELVNARYDYHCGPCVNGWPCNEAGELCINCQLLTHIVLAALGCALPAEMRSAELFRQKARLDGRRSPKQKLLQSVEPSAAKVGDIFFLARSPYTGKTKDEEFSYHSQLHLAVCIEPAQKIADIQLIHAHCWTHTEAKTHPGQAVSVWSLSDFWQSTRYPVLYGVRRKI